MIKWENNENNLLLNPRLPRETYDKVLTSWKKVEKDFVGHIGLLTSGSSSSAKLVLISKQAVLAAAQGANQHLVAGRSDTWLKTLPEFHVGGLSIYARSFLAGSKVIEFENWDAKKIHQFASHQKVTLISLVSAQLFDLVSLNLSSPPTLRAVVVGGGALQSDLYSRARALSWPVLPSYGLTECSSQVATASIDNFSSDKSDLILLPHIEAKTNTEGKLQIKSKALLTGYVDLQTQKFSDPKVNDWFTTEDVVEIHENILKVRGRTQDFLKIGGESSDFLSLENVFLSVWRELGLSGDAALLPIPDKRLGSILALATSGVPSAAVTTLINRYNSKVMPYERIRQNRELKQIPRSELGKLLRSRAIEEYIAQS